MKVLTSIAGSRCVIQKNSEHYLDARTDTRYPGFSFIEVVLRGHVQKRECVPDTQAPECLIDLIRSELL